MRIEPHSDANYATPEPQTLWWTRPLQNSYMTHVVHTARISNVDTIMMGNWFELGEEVEKDVRGLDKSQHEQVGILITLGIVHFDSDISPIHQCFQN